MPKRTRSGDHARPKREIPDHLRPPKRAMNQPTSEPSPAQAKRPVIMPSQSVHHATPLLFLQGIVYPVLGEPIDLDPCSNDQSIVKARRKISLPDDGLAVPWRGKIYVNPPYGMPAILEWVKKCVLENRHNGAEIIALLPANTSAEWFDIVAATSRAAFLWGPGLGGRRLHFIGNDNNAGFHSVVVYWGPNLPEFTRAAMRYCHPWFPEHDLRLALAMAGSTRLPEGAACSLAQADQILTLSRNDDLVAALTALGSATLGDILDAGASPLLARLRQVCAYELGASLLYASRTDSKAWIDHRIPSHPRKLDPRQLDLGLAVVEDEDDDEEEVVNRTIDELVFEEIRRGSISGNLPSAQELKDRCVCSQGQLRGAITRLRREHKIEVTGRTQGVRYRVCEEGKEANAG